MHQIVCRLGTTLGSLQCSPVPRPLDAFRGPEGKEGREGKRRKGRGERKEKKVREGKEVWPVHFSDASAACDGLTCNVSLNDKQDWLLQALCQVEVLLVNAVLDSLQHTSLGRRQGLHVIAGYRSVERRHAAGPRSFFFHADIVTTASLCLCHCCRVRRRLLMLVCWNAWLKHTFIKLRGMRKLPKNTKSSH